ncbi:hypothetical protein A3860_11970 [Niastella vici]|uniref:Cytochrome oxidase subunit I profile domain-containing protein n=2 Tax=Niastella vici TaxID=1703345 RepID=A0A1V9FFY2_9BACT|nr:hypothetical protein A3860_11970 [Niastella vici]
MKNKQFWITTSLVNLCIVALLGFTLRSKILFPLNFINYGNLINAHSHFAFGGWLTLAFLNLFTHTLVPLPYQQRAWYQWMLWGMFFTAVGMLFSFPFQGYGPIAIIFSTLFIFFTYGYSWVFIKDILTVKNRPPAYILAFVSIICLVISSAGPFTLAYLMASKSGNAILFKDAIYFYLHFQYNGFFTLAVFAMLFFAANTTGLPNKVPVITKWFTWLLCASVLPSFFLTLLWHSGNWERTLAILGAVLIIGCLICLFKVGSTFPIRHIYRSLIARWLWFLALFSFVIKSLLQTGTLFPGLGNAVFGLRPVIIGFLHLVFLGLCTFYILSNYISTGAFTIEKRFVRSAIFVFAGAVIFQETILLIQGVGLLLGNASPIYNWLLWLAAIGLFVGSFMLVVARLKSREG